MTTETAPVPATDTPAMPAVLAAVQYVMKVVTGIAKRGEGPANQGRYSYRKLDDVVDDLGTAFREAMLMVQSQVLNVDYTQYEVEGRNGRTMWSRCTLTIRYRITSLEDGSFLDFEAIGQGLDNSDKSSNKAMSGAYKYALCQALMIRTGDPDPDGEGPRVTSQPADGETAAQRTLRERREQQAGSTAPAPEQPAVDGQAAEPAPAATAQPAADPEQLAQAERDATMCLTEAAKTAAQADTENAVIKLQSQQIERARKAMQAGTRTADRHMLNRIIIQCSKEGFLAASVDGKNVGGTLAAARGMLS